MMLDRARAKSRDTLLSSTHSASTCEPPFDLPDIPDLSLLLIRVHTPGICDTQL